MGFYTSKVQGTRMLKGDYYVTGVLNVGNPSYVFQLTSGSGAILSTASGSIPGALRKKLKIAIDGVDYYVLAASDWVNATSSTPSASKSPSASLSPSASASSSPSPSH